MRLPFPPRGSARVPSLLDLSYPASPGVVQSWGLGVGGFLALELSPVYNAPP